MTDAMLSQTNQRAQAVIDAVAAAGPGPHHMDTPAGPIVLERVALTVDPDSGVTAIEVHADEFADPHIRVINPPRYVPDPNGPVTINGQRFREDPLAALAHVVAQHGGRRKDPRRGIR
jgi:hypothetical protein